MRIDDSAVDRFLAYVDGERPIEDVWDHPAYQVTQRHAGLLGRDLSQRDVEAALAGEETVFGGVRNLEANRAAIANLREHVRLNEATWRSTIREALERITPSADLTDVTIYLGIGYEFGIGLQDGAYLNLNEPLFHDDPRQILYTAIHESSHVVYDGFHEFSDDLGPELLDSANGRRRYFEILFHMEAYATYTPLAYRQDDGSLGAYDHPVSDDYRVIDDDERLGALTERYDSFTQELASGDTSAQDVFGHIFGEFRLPYRLGTVMLDRAESQEGMDTVRSGFRLEPERFLAEFDPYLAPFR